MSLRYWPPGYWGRADDVTAHSGLTGLAADDHPQYALLAGRAGGQTLIGGTAASNTLTLRSTSHATKGKIVFGTLGTSVYDEVNNRWGFGKASPAYNFDFYGDGGDAVLSLSSGASGANAYVLLGRTSTDFLFGVAVSGGSHFSNAAAGDSVIKQINTGSKLLFGVGASTASIACINGGNVGIGTVSPTAVLHLKAGTATANTAPLKFTTGTLLTTPEVGAMEYNNTPWFTNSDAVRRSIVLSSGTFTGGAVAVGGTVQVNINGTNYNMLVQ